MKHVTVKEVSIEQIVEVSKKVVEFDAAYPKEHFANRYNGREHLLIVGFVDNEPAGYIVAYDRDQDGSLYCWMAGVDPEYRRLGVLTKLMDYQTAWAKQHGYKILKIKTRNNRREMLANLIKRGFLLTEVVQHSDPADNRISLEQTLED